MTSIFSKRSRWPNETNRLMQALERKCSGGVDVWDASESNPMKCSFEYPQKFLPNAFESKRLLSYEPDPKGSLELRKLISSYYAEKNAVVDPEHILLTASTSESYGFLFKLLCNAGEEVLIPKPGYPLFDLIADLHDIRLKPYYSQLENNHWILDTDFLRSSITEKTKAVVIVHPNNPTGHFFSHEDLSSFYKICPEKFPAIIADEVFLDFDYQKSPKNISTFASENKQLTFTLGGASKMLGFPQLKLGWIVIGGPDLLRDEALRRLEIIADTYLSVSAAAQCAFIKIYENKTNIQGEIKDRVLKNLDILQVHFKNHPVLSCQNVEGGWYALLKSTHHFEDETFCLKLLEEQNIFIHPGYFFDLPANRYLGLSLLLPSKHFEEVISKLSKFAEIQL